MLRSMAVIRLFACKLNGWKRKLTGWKKCARMNVDALVSRHRTLAAGQMLNGLLLHAGDDFNSRG